MIPQHFDHHKFPVQIQVVEILHLSKGFEKLIERSRNPSIYNLIWWFTEPMGQTDQTSDVPSIIFLKNLAEFFAKIISIFFYKFTKMKIKSFEYVP